MAAPGARWSCVFNPDRFGRVGLSLDHDYSAVINGFVQRVQKQFVREAIGI